VSISKLSTSGSSGCSGQKATVAMLRGSILGAVLLLVVAAAPSQERRVPAEWEPHAATWMQWPGFWEAGLRPAFAAIIDVVQDYEPVHLLTSTVPQRDAARAYLLSRGVPDVNITWHIVPVDSAWMRDNGPVYVVEGGQTRVQNWSFDAWGGNFGSDVPFANDDSVPAAVAAILGLPVEDRQGYVLERGNLELNGAGTLVLGWDCQDDRNPGMTRAEHEAVLADALGVTTILWAYGHHPLDLTTGHIDGVARFVDHDTIAIADDGSATATGLAAECAAAGLEVVWYPGDPNWLVGNGFVAAMSSGQPITDQLLRAQLATLFPGRDVFMVDGSALAAAGGGIHCVTNDQPAVPAPLFADGFETGDVSAWGP